MRELHVVAVSEDGRHVLLAGQRGASQGGFRVALDERLSAAVRGDLPRPGQAEPAASELTPKEIQSRLRAGESAESIALAAGVPVARVERFSGPVQGEMARVIDAARSSYLVRGRLGRSAVTLGAAVDANIALSPSLRADSTDWETRRQDDGTWLVTVTWFARKRSREAAWRYDPATKTVTAADPASAALGHAETAAPTARTRAAAAAAPAKPAAKSAAKRAGTKATPKAAKAPAKRASTKAAAKPVAAKKAPAKKAPAKKAPAAAKAAPTRKAAAKAPAARTPAKKTAAAAPIRAARSAVPPKAVPVRAARTVPARTVPATTAPAKAARKAPVRQLRVVPDPAPRAKTAAERDGVKTRASVPGWADVLLGTTPGGDR